MHIILVLVCDEVTTAGSLPDFNCFPVGELLAKTFPREHISEKEISLLSVFRLAMTRCIARAVPTPLLSVTSLGSLECSSSQDFSER
jgi:hypothetical protein